MHLLLPLALLVALTPVVIAGAGTEPPAIRATAVPLDPADPARVRLGPLDYLGGWVLASRDRRFGGLSALAVTGPGRLLALSDTGLPVAIALGRDGPRAQLLPALDTGGVAGGGKAASDSEALARDPASGSSWVAVEKRNAIIRYDRAGKRVGLVAPAAMRHWPRNGGAESLARLADGRFLVIAETAAAAGAHEALLFASDPTLPGAPAPLRLAYRSPAGGYEPSDAAPLPDGRVVVLNRRVTMMDGFLAILTVIDPRRAAPGAILSGATLATLGSPLTVDNMEGVAIGREGGRTILWLVSDDNFLPVQRTLLMKFALR